MTTTTIDNPTWRDFADELTPEQLDRLERLESIGEDQHVLLWNARAAAHHNGLAADIGDVPLPPGVVEVGLWEQGRSDFQAGRLLGGKVRDVDGQFEVRTWIVQHADRTLETETVDRPHVVLRDMSVEGALTARQARQLARALIAAADELDSWVAG